nr:MAG TPA: hypothetical protein [Caudoviricetes sp.]
MDKQKPLPSPLGRRNIILCFAPIVTRCVDWDHTGPRRALRSR